MSNKRKLNKQKLPWGTMGGSTNDSEPFGDWTPFDSDGRRFLPALPFGDYQAITGLLFSRAEMRRMQEGLA